MKKLIPAIAFMFVLALSFAFRPAPAKAEKGKKFETEYYKYVDGDWVSTTAGFSCPSGTTTVCKIEVDNSYNISLAQSYALANPNAGTVTDFDSSTPGNQQLVIIPRP